MVTQREFFMIHQYKSEGLFNRTIARLEIDRKSMKRQLCQDTKDLGRQRRATARSSLDSNRKYLFEQLQQYLELSARRLQREIQRLGYRVVTSFYATACTRFDLSQRVSSRFDSKPRRANRRRWISRLPCPSIHI